jgi:hypothetical protein
MESRIKNNGVYSNMRYGNKVVTDKIKAGYWPISGWRRGGEEEVDLANSKVITTAILLSLPTRGHYSCTT